MLNKMNMNEPKEKQTPLAIRNQLHELYLESNCAYLEISLPKWDEPVIFNEGIYTNSMKDSSIPKYLKEEFNRSFLVHKQALFAREEEKKEKPVIKEGFKISLKNRKIMKVYDPLLNKKDQPEDVDFERSSNPVTEKYYILTRSEDDALSKGLTPDLETSNSILKIIGKPDFSTLNMEEKHLLWKYRYSLKNDERYRKGVVKFLLSVNWKRNKEEGEALEMLSKWEIGLEQAIPMLSDLFSSNEYYPSEIPVKV